MRMEDKVRNKDMLVISALRHNSRQTLSQMSRSIRVPLSTIHDRIKGLEGSIVKKHTAIVDFGKLGYNTRACLLLKVDKERKMELQEHLSRCSHVNSLAKVNNGHDFMVEVVFENIKEMEEYLDSIDQKFSFRGKEVFYIIDDIKREEFMANPNMVRAGFK